MVATNVGGVGDLVIDGVTGFLVENENVRDEAMRAVSILAYDAGLRQEMGDRAQALAKHLYSRSRHLETLKNLYLQKCPF